MGEIKDYTESVDGVLVFYANKYLKRKEETGQEPSLRGFSEQARELTTGGIVLDFDGIFYIRSMDIAELLRYSTELKDAGKGPLYLCGLADKPKKLLEAVGASNAGIRVSESIDEAVAGISKQ
jgi:anti-anti-sigma regulatory factor